MSLVNSSATVLDSLVNCYLSPPHNCKGEEVDSPDEAEEVVEDPDELADIEEERREIEEEAFRAERWPAYVRYVDSLVSANADDCKWPLIFKF